MEIVKRTIVKIELFAFQELKTSEENFKIIFHRR